jgi:hypothetical protein
MARSYALCEVRTSPRQVSIAAIGDGGLSGSNHLSTVVDDEIRSLLVHTLLGVAGRLRLRHAGMARQRKAITGTESLHPLKTSPQVLALGLRSSRRWAGSKNITRFSGVDAGKLTRQSSAREAWRAREALTAQPYCLTVPPTVFEQWSFN